MAKGGHSILRNSLWVLSSNVTQRIVGFFVGIVMARLLAPEDFGLVVTMSVFTGIAGYFAAGGMGDALVRSKDLRPTDFDTVFAAQSAICLLIYLGFFCVAPAFARWMDEPRYELLLRISALTFLLRPVLNVANSKISREMRFKELSIIRLIKFCITSVCGIALALAGLGPWALIFSGLIGAVVIAPVTLWKARWRPGFRWDVPALKRLGGTGLKFSGNHIVDYIRSQIPNLFVSKFMGPTATGLFNRGLSLSVMPVGILGGSLYEPLFRGLSAIQEDPGAAKALFMRAGVLLSFYATPVYILIWWLADPLIPLLYGEKWRATIEPLRILTLTGVFLLHHPAGALVAARNRLGRELVLNVQALVVLVIACILLLPYGAPGIAAAYIIGRMYSGIRICGLALSSVGGSWLEVLRALSPIYALNAVLFGCLWFADRVLPPLLRLEQPWLYLAGMLAVGATIYAGLAHVFPHPVTQTESRRWQQWLKNRLSV